MTKMKIWDGVVPEMTDEQRAEMGRKIQEAAKRREVEERERTKTGIFPTPVECPFCKSQGRVSMIVEEWKQEWTEPPSQRIMGPGSRNQIRRTHGGYWCQECGIEYRKLPGK